MSNEPIGLYNEQIVAQIILVELVFTGTMLH